MLATAATDHFVITSRVRSERIASPEDEDNRQKIVSVICFALYVAGT